MKIKLPDASLPTHPQTGLRAVFVSPSGSPVWPHRGSDGDEGGDDGGSNDGEGSEDDNDDDHEGSEGEDGKKTSNGTVSREEFDELKRKFDQQSKHLSAADKKKAAAEKELADLKKKDLPDGEKVAAELKEVTAERDTYREKFTNLARTNAFLTASAQEKIAWHDPEDAQAVAGKELRELDIDDNGTVDGIRDLVKALAKRKPHLVNAKVNSGDDSDEEKGKKKTNGASGSGVGTRGKKPTGQKGQLSSDELRRRFAIR